MVRPQIRFVYLAAAAVLGTFAASCDDGPPGGPSQIQAVRLELRGPSSIAPGQTASYSAIEHMSDGASRPASTTTWTSSDASLVSVTPAGVATTQPRTGEVVITARAGRLGVSREVLVLPDGTFRLAGRITDTGTPGQPIPDVRVEITGGPAATSGTDGGYRLYGAPGDGEIRVTRDGYRPHVQRLQLAGNGALNFVLEPDGTLGTYDGAYTLTVEAAPSCATASGALPEDLRRRSYGAVIRQTGFQLVVELTDPQFLRRQFAPGNTFRGLVVPGGARFDLLTEYYYSVADVAELLADGSVLSPSGRATLTGSPTGLSGSLSGWISHYTSQFAYLDGCAAGSFTLSPR